MAIKKTVKKQSVKKETSSPYGLKVFGVYRVFVNEFEIKKGKNKRGTFLKHTISISKKNEDGEYFNLYMPVLFSKEIVAPQETSVIDITEAYFMVQGNEGYETIGLYIKDYEELEEE